MSARLTHIRFVLALLTLLAIAVKPAIPPDIHVLHPAGFSVGHYGPPSPTLTEPATWLDDDRTRWRCEVALDASTNFGCGGGLAWSGLRQATLNAEQYQLPACSHTRFDHNFDGWGEEDDATCIVVQGATEGINDSHRNTFDATGFSHLRLKLSYEGRADFLQVGLRNDDPRLNVNGRTLQPKVMSTLIATERVRGGYADIALADFHVAEWWVSENDPPRHMALPAFDHLTSLSIDTAARGVHHFELKEVMLVGDKFSNTAFLSTLASLWLVFLLLEGAWRYRAMTRDRRLHAMQLGRLADDTDALTNNNAKLRREACTDALTGVLNRSGLYQSLKALDQATIAVIVIDIDHFKPLNDRYGHAAGDDVLRAFAKRVNKRIRKGDIVARWGGEEFIVVLRTNNLQSAKTFAENLRATIAGTAIVDEPVISISASFGVALSRKGEPFDALFKRADTALYRAKVHRNQVVCDED